MDPQIGAFTALLCLLLQNHFAQVSASLPFKIMLVTDNASKEDDKIARIVNATVLQIAKDYFEFDVTSLTTRSVEKAYQDLCSKLEYGAASFVLSVAKNQVAMTAVKRAARISTIPTIQVDYVPFYHERFGQEANSSSLNVSDKFAELYSRQAEDANYFTVFPPIVTYLNSVLDFLIAINGNGSRAAFLYYDLPNDVTIKKMLSAMPNSEVLMERAANGSAQVDRQLANLRAREMKFIFLVMSVNRSEEYIAQAHSYFVKKEMAFILLTEDLSPFRCEACLLANLTRVQIEVGDEIYIKKFKDYIRTNGQDFVLTLETEVDVSFYVDLAHFVYEAIVYMNSTLDMFPIYGCSNSTTTSGNLTTTLTGVVHAIGFHGSHGSYEELKEGKFYQDIVINIKRIQNEDGIDDTRQVANWTMADGLQILYDMLGGDIKQIRFYRVVVVEPPFIEKYSKRDGTSDYRGYCIDLINRIAEQRSFNYSLREVRDGMLGSMNEKGEWNGLIRELLNGNADIALAPLAITAEREANVDFTVPFYDLVGTTILMKKPRNEFSLFKFMAILDGPVWGCIGGAYFLTSMLLWIFDRFSPYSYTNNKEKYKDDPERREFNLRECFWFCMTSLTPQGGGEAPKNISSRLGAASWWAFGFIIIASYTANLAAFMTVKRLEAPITSLDDLAKQVKIKYAPVRGTTSELYFKRMAEIESKFYEFWKQVSINDSTVQKLAIWDYPVSDKFTNMYRFMQDSGFPNTSAEAIERVRRSTSDNNFAFIGDATEIKYAVITDCQLQQIGNDFSRKPYAIAVPKRNALTDQLTIAILNMINQRELDSLKEKWWTNNPNRVECMKTDNEMDGIGIENIGGVFIVILIGIVASFCTLLLEYWYYKIRLTDHYVHERQDAFGRRYIVYTDPAKA